VNITKIFLRTWLSLVSLVGFLMVWLYLARASEPPVSRETPQTDATATAALTPIPDLDSLIKPVTLTPGSVKTFNLITATLQPADKPTAKPPAPLPTFLPTALPTIAALPQPTATPTLLAITQTPTSVPPRLRTGAS
jgi:hypothetical protein